MELCRKCAAEPYPFLFIDTTLPLNNPLHFRKILLEEVYRAVMTIVEKIREYVLQKNLQYDIKRAAAKISALLLGNIDKYEYLTGKQILPLHQHRIL